MSQDLEEYQHIIEQLKPMISEPEFNQALMQVASSVPKPKRFLIKMELKRLARPCIRSIDLRSQSKGECREYEYDGTRHYLDDNGIEVFERQVRSFGDYTIGVYEAVLSSKSESRRKSRDADLADPEENLAIKHNSDPFCAPVVQFGDFYQRAEERMNYAVGIEVFNDANKGVTATTVDVSVGGLKIKVNQKEQFKTGESVTVQFRGFEGEYAIDKKLGIPYTVVSIDHSRKEQRLSLKRVFDIPNPGFDDFLEKFIHGNKRRYKVNMDNTLDAIQLKAYEQYFTPNFTSVPVYIEELDGQYVPKYALANDCNRDLLYYWTDEVYELKLGYAINHSRIKAMLEMPVPQRETYIYSFNHIKDDKIYFYSATREELLKDEDLMPVFLGYGARKASWRIYKVQLTDVNLDDVHTPLSIPDVVSATVKRQNQPPPPRLLAKLKHVSHVALITDITDEHNHSGYESLPIQKERISALKKYGHPRNKIPPAVSMFRFKYHNQRKETRYQLRTRVEVMVDDIVLEGVSEDVSVKGLRIELGTFYHGAENSEVKISFPQLQKVTQKYDLTNLLYRVKGISADRNVIHLQAIHDLVNTTAQRFFDELIRKNKSRLKAYKEEEDIPGIGTALRNLYAQNLLNTAFFIRKDGVDFVPDAVVSHNHQSRLHNLLSFDAEPGFYNLYALYNTAGPQADFISSTLKKIKTNRKPISRELFVAFDPSRPLKNGAIISRFSEQFKSPSARKSFISEAMNRGQFIAIKVFLARTGRPDTEFIQSEISYVGVYAVHRAKVVEEQLWNVVGMGDLLDITDDVMQRHQFSETDIAANTEPPQYDVKEGKIEQLLKA